MKKLFLAGCIVVVLIVCYFRISAILRPLSIIDIVSQLNGGKCVYEFRAGEAVKRGLFASHGRRDDAVNCIKDAVEILATKRNEVDIVPPLISALKQYHNYYTGDGMINLRSEIASVLGELGDKRALSPLSDILQSEDQTTISPNATQPSVLKNRGQDKQTSFPAVKEAIQKINEANK